MRRPLPLCPDGHEACGCAYGGACCLRCTLAVCRYERSSVVQVMAVRLQERYAVLAAAYRARGQSVHETAVQFGVSVRTVKRALEAMNGGQQ